MPRKFTPSPRQLVCRYCGKTFEWSRTKQQRLYCDVVCFESSRRGRRGEIPIGRIFIRSEDNQRIQVTVDAQGLPYPITLLE